MKKTSSLFLTLCLGVAFTACNHHADENPTGSWTSSTPLTVTESVVGATSATKTISFDFDAISTDKVGEVVYSADYNVTAPVIKEEGEEVTLVSYKVTASIKGTWEAEADEHDDYLLSFDINTLSVHGTDAPELGPVTDEFVSTLSTFATIEDVKIINDGTHMTFESKKNDLLYHFVKK